MAKPLQLNPTIEMNTPKGHGVCHFLIHDANDSVARWLVLQEDGQWWEWQNHQVRGIRNFSQNRPGPEKPPIDPVFDNFKLKASHAYADGAT